MKKIILLLVLILSMALVYALTEGQIITQTQLDSTDVWSVNLDCNYDGLTREYFNGNLENLRFKFSCLNLNIQDDGDYEVFRNNFTASYAFYRYLDCRVDGAKQKCIKEIKDEVINDARVRISDIRVYLNSLQTPDTPDFTDDDLSISDGDLS